MTRMGKPGEWDEEAFQRALLRFPPEERERIERMLRSQRELFLRLAVK